MMAGSVYTKSLLHWLEHAMNHPDLLVLADRHTLGRADLTHYVAYIWGADYGVRVGEEIAWSDSPRERLERGRKNAMRIADRKRKKAARRKARR